MTNFTRIYTTLKSTERGMIDMDAVADAMERMGETFKSIGGYNQWLLVGSASGRDYFVELDQFGEEIRLSECHFGS